MAEFELDLTGRSTLVKPELTLDLTQPHYQQTDFVQVFEPELTESLPQADKPVSDWTDADWQDYEQHKKADDIKAHLHSAKLAEPQAQLPSIQEFTIAKLAEQYNYKGNLTIGALEDEIVFRVRRSASDVLEAGKALIILKEVAGHGNFNKRVELMGFKMRTAQNYMRVAETFGKSASNAYLANEIGQYQKLLEMTFFESEELETLANGGDIDGIDIEQIKALSAPKLKKLIQSRVDTETKAALEQAEADKKTLADDVASLNKQIENHEKHYSELQAKHELTERQLKHLTNTRSTQKYNATTLMLREEAALAAHGVRVYVDEIKALFSQYLTSTDHTPNDQAAREHALGLAVGSIYAEVLELYQAVTSVIEPPELTGQFAMTDEELKRLADCRLMLDHTYTNDKTARELRREEKSRKGRPMGS